LQVIANASAGIVLVCLIITSGFAILRTNIPAWWVVYGGDPSRKQTAIVTPLCLYHPVHHQVDDLFCQCQIHRRMIWAYWLSPFAWGLRCFAINELTTPKWQV
jgi:hypothetical protein